MYRDKAIKKIAKSQRYLVDSDRKFRFEYLYLIVLAVFTACMILFGFNQPEESDKGNYLMLSQTFIFMMVAYYSVSMLSGFSTNFKQRNTLKGSSSLNDIFVQFPVTKMQCMMYSFNKWAKASMLSIICLSVVILQVMYIPQLSQFKGEIGFIVLALILMQSYSLFVYSFSYKMKTEIRTVLSYIMILLIFFYMFLSMVLCRFEFIYSMFKCFKAFSGPLGLACLYINIPLMYLIGKLFVFKTKK